MRRALLRALFAGALALLAPFAAAEGYPSGPVTLIIPLAAGDATDTAARVMAEALAREGRYAEAIAHRFVALVLALEQRRAVVFHPSKTPAEYVNEARLDPSGRASLAALVGRLYRHVFGAVPCADPEYRDFTAAADLVLQHVAPA